MFFFIFERQITPYMNQSLVHRITMFFNFLCLVLSHEEEEWKQKWVHFTFHSLSFIPLLFFSFFPLTFLSQPNTPLMWWEEYKNKIITGFILLERSRIKMAKGEDHIYTLHENIEDDVCMRPQLFCYRTYISRITL